jgi:hypothetical protein
LPWQLSVAAPLTATATDDDDSDGGGGSDTSSSSGNSDDTRCISAPPGAKLPGGLRKGIGYLFTGRPCHFHIIHGSTVSLPDLLNGLKSYNKFSFRRHVAMDNSTVSEVIAALGGGEKTSVTQVWEWGDGMWKKGSKMKYGADKAGLRLSELGWSDAGSRKKSPVWLYYKEK